VVIQFAVLHFYRQTFFMIPAPGLSTQFASPQDVLVWMLSATGEGEFFSPSWQAFTGQALATSLGHGWLDAFHADNRAHLMAAIDQSIAEGGNFRLQLRVIAANGEGIWHHCEGVARLDTNGTFVGLIGICSDITRQVRAEAEAELGERRIVDLLPQTDMVALALDNAGHTLFFNRALTELLGVPAEEIDKNALLTHFLDRQHLSLKAILFPNDGEPIDRLPSTIETEYIEGRSGIHVFRWHPIVLCDYASNASGLILIGDDMTERRLAEEQLRLTSRVFESTDLAMLITDIHGTILSTNSAFTRLTGYDTEEAVGKNPRILQSGRHAPLFYQEMWQTLFAEGYWQGEVWDRRKDGSVYPKSLSITALRNDHGDITHFSGIFYDISERKSIVEQLDRLAHFDALTELPNRRFLLDRLSMACHQAIMRQQPFALLFLDLDRFKSVNDLLGHQAGDEFLRTAARRLRDAIRAQDIAARIGGDEFTVLLMDIKEATHAARVAQKIIDTFAIPFDIGGEPMTITTSIGIALSPHDGTDPECLLRHADQAMYRAKAAGRNGYCFFGCATPDSAL
jgi:diguanylate cyclase (GGDEF)-like protein/PAS domain S-box-containing protein